MVLDTQIRESCHLPPEETEDGLGLVVIFI